VIDILGPDGAIFARGLAEYDAAACLRIIGHQSEELESLLGYAPRSAMVHRNNMVLL